MDQRSKIAILGFGLEGRAMFSWLLEHGHRNITVCDKNVDLEDEMPEGVSVRLGPGYLDGLEDFDVIFRSPGLRVLEPAIAAVALRDDVELTSVTKFFMDQCPCPVIGVTGTKGKGTTCTLIYEILKAAGRDVWLGGNIGVPPIEFLDKLNGESIVVLEMSSFQLQDVEKSPHYGVLLNTTSEHLDYHADRAEYLEAKEGLLAHQHEGSVAVLNKDYDYEKYYRPLVKGSCLEVSVKGPVESGAYVKGGEIFATKENDAVKICAVNEVALIGAHNLENVLPATAVAWELGVEAGVIADAIREFKGLEHRLELVRELQGVRYYNDSFSTDVLPCMAAVDSFEEPMILIAGGRTKGADYGEWAERILKRENLKVVILIGEVADEMEEALVDAEAGLGAEAEGGDEGELGGLTKVLRRDSLEDAVVEAYAESEEGWVVVMSPAATSFDMFKNYKERGKAFKREVRRLK